MFPLNTVIYPGMSIPLHVFEDRYRALIHQLLREPDPGHRLFGSVAIREGYEVGEHGNQSLYRVGCRLQLTDVAGNPDGSFDVVAVGQDRIRLDRLDTSAAYPSGEVTVVPDRDDPVDAELIDRARMTFGRFLELVGQWQEEPFDADLPTAAGPLSWSLAALTPLPMHEHQGLLEADSVAERLVLITDLLREEIRSIRAVPSLPASGLARTRWSPN